MEEGRRSRRRILVPAVSLLLVVVASAWLIVRETRLKRPPQLTTTMAGNIDMCLSCHKDVKLDPAHDPAVIGCAPCHLGNPLAVTEKAAHKGMVLNPGDLRVVEQTCAVEGCHPKDAHKVKNSLMATNRGILGTLLYYWGEAPSQNTDLTVEAAAAVRPDLARPRLLPQTVRHLPSVEAEERPARRGGLLQRQGRRLLRLPFSEPAGGPRRRYPLFRRRYGPAPGRRQEETPSPGEKSDRQRHLHPLS